MSFKRGDIYLAAVERTATRGSEQFSDPGAPRPWLIVCDPRVTSLGLVIACPFTSKTDKHTAQPLVAPFRVLLPPARVEWERRPGEAIKPRESLVLCEQIRVMSIDRLATRVGTVQPDAMAEVDAALLRVLRL